MGSLIWSQKINLDINVMSAAGNKKCDTAERRLTYSKKHNPHKVVNIQ